MSPPRSTIPPGSPGQASRIARRARVAEKPLPMPPRSTAAPLSIRARLSPAATSISAAARQPGAARAGAPRAARTCGRSPRRRGPEGSSDRTSRPSPRGRGARRGARLPGAGRPRPTLPPRGSGGRGRLPGRSGRGRARRPRPPRGPRRARAGRVARPRALAVTESVQAVPIARKASWWSRPIIPRAPVRSEWSRAAPRPRSTRARRTAASSRSCP